jgi:O-antigen/teichoic acid export membrane protein
MPKSLGRIGGRVSVSSSEASAHVADESGVTSESAGGAGQNVDSRDVAKRERRQFITHNAVAAAGTWLAGILGLLLQALVSHHFSPRLYGEVFAVFSFFTVLTQPAAGFSRMVAWTTSRELATKNGTDVESSALLRMTIRRLTLIGTALGLVFIIGGGLLANYLAVPLSYVIVGAVGVPFMFATSPMLASLQGEQRWIPWSALSIGIALSRVIFVVIFAFWLGPGGVMLGISVAAAVLYLIALVMVWPRMRRGHGPTGWRPLWRFLLVSVTSTVTVSVLLGSDVVLVQHFYPGKLAGQFSAVTVTSRALFFAMGSITSVLFPKVAARHARQRGTRSVVFTSVGIALIGGLLGLVVFSLLSTTILHDFSGKSYEGGRGYIGWYALGMPLLAAVVMLSNTQQSLADLNLLWVLIPGTLIKPLLIYLFHQSLFVVSLMSDVAIAAVLVALAVQYLLTERRQRLPVSRSGSAPDDDAGSGQGLMANAPA